MSVGQTDLVALNVLKHPWACGKAAIPIECRVGEDQVDLDAGVVDILLEQEEGRLDPMELVDLLPHDVIRDAPEQVVVTVAVEDLARLHIHVQRETCDVLLRQELKCQQTPVPSHQDERDRPVFGDDFIDDDRIFCPSVIREFINACIGGLFGSRSASSRWR